MDLCIDIGGTNIRIANVVNDKVIDKVRIKTPNSREKLLKELCSLISLYKYDKIKISIAGMINNNEIILTPHLPLSNFNLKKFLENKFSKKVYIENDAVCASIAEKKYGFGKNYKNFVFLTIGTGIGGAVFINKKLYRGRGLAGEVGHMFVQKGRNGEYESSSSGIALQKLVKKYGLTIEDSYRLTELVHSGNKKAKVVLDIMAANISKGISNIVCTLDPQAIILSGGLSSIKPLVDRVKKMTNEENFARKDVKIICSKLGDDANLIGADMLIDPI